MRELREDKGNPANSENQKTETTEKDSRKYSNNYFRRSMVKCIQSFVDKNESNELMEHLKNEKEKVYGRKKHLDYVPVLTYLFRFTRWSIKLSKLSDKCSSTSSMYLAWHPNRHRTSSIVVKIIG